MNYYFFPSSILKIVKVSITNISTFRTLIKGRSDQLTKFQWMSGATRYHTDIAAVDADKSDVKGYLHYNSAVAEKVRFPIQNKRKTSYRKIFILRLKIFGRKPHKGGSCHAKDQN